MPLQLGPRGGNVSAENLAGRSLAWRLAFACPCQPSPANPSSSRPGRVGLPQVTLIAACGRWQMPGRPPASPRRSQKQALNVTPASVGGALASLPGGTLGEGVPLASTVLRVSSWRICPELGRHRREPQRWTLFSS